MPETIARPNNPWEVVPRAEFRQRQDHARRAAAERELDGLVVFSKGGACLDMHADVLYLTNHYSQVPYVPDHFGIGHGRSHAAVILPIDGPTILISDIAYWREDHVVADEIRVGENVPELVQSGLQDTNLLNRRIGIVGMSYMTASTYCYLMDKVGEDTFERTDLLLEKIRRVKSPAEKEIIRQGMEIANQAMNALMGAAEEGATVADAVSQALQIMTPSGAVLYDAACTSGAQSSQFAWSRLPSFGWRKSLQRGELFHVDFYGGYGGYLWDFARTRVVGQKESTQQSALIETCIGAVDHLCGEIRPGMTGGDVYEAFLDWVKTSTTANLLLTGEDLEVPFVGHGLGLSWEGPLLERDNTTVLEEGMVLAIEAFLSIESIGGALYEQNGFVEKNGFKVLTTCRSRWD